MKKVMLIFGTRPEAIKMCPLVKEFQKDTINFKTVVCVTAQHREMLDQVLHVFDVKPEYDLNIMKQGQDLYDITSRVLLGLRDVLKKELPDIVLVHGDTTTSSAAALAAFYQQIPVGHVEAGLRTHNIYIPLSLLSLWKSGERKMVLITGHRRENFGEGFIHICKAIKTLAEKYSMVDFVYPMHLNPNVRKPIAEILGESHKETLTNVFLIEPLDYLPFVYLMNHSTIVLTDSGGIQEEAPGLGKPVLVMRDTTERPEALEAGTVKLVGTGYNSIIDNVSDLLENKDLYRQMSKAQNPYGDGKTSQSIVNILL